MKQLIIFSILILQSVCAFAQSKEVYLESYNFNRGRELLFSSKPDRSGAMDFFNKELKEHPYNGYAIYFMGLIYDDESQEGKALDCLNQAVILLKKDRDWISYVYRLRAQVYLKLGKDDLAKKDWKESLKENPTDENTLSDRADYYYDRGDYALSDADYDVIISSHPESSLGYMGKGRNAVAMENYNLALKQFDYSIALDPNDSQVYAFRAQTFIALHKYNEAADDIIKAIDIDYNVKAFTLTEVRESPFKDILLAKFRIQQAKDKNDSRWSNLQGRIFELNNDYKDAIKAYQAANVINTTSFTTYRLSKCLAEIGDYTKALEEINRALAIDSTDNDYYLHKADCLYELGRTRDALDVLTYYISKEPDYFFGYYRSNSSLKIQYMA